MIKILLAYFENIKHWRKIILILLIVSCPIESASSSRVSFNRGSLGSATSKKYSSSNSNSNGYAHENQMYFNMLEDNETLMGLPAEQRLIYTCLRLYDPASRPVYNASKPVTIKFNFALIQICDMVYNNNKIKIHIRKLE